MSASPRKRQEMEQRALAPFPDGARYIETDSVSLKQKLQAARIRGLVSTRAGDRGRWIHELTERGQQVKAEAHRG